MTTHIITGGTGFLGSAMIIELLRDDVDARVVGIVRADDDASATTRLRDRVLQACDEFDENDIRGVVDQQVHGIAGDITKPLCDVAAGDVETDAEVVVWHAAASLQFRESSMDQLTMHNVEGTLNVIQLAESLGAKSYNHISTSYVAGERNGDIPEELPKGLENTNNAYEKSKISAELGAIEACEKAGLPFKILRPSVIIGHSVTGRGFNYTGVFTMAQGLMATKILCGKARMTLKPGDFNLLADRDLQANLIPIDVAARNTVACGLRGTSNKVYHITNDYLTPLVDSLKVVTDMLDMPQAEFVSSADQLSAIGHMYNDHLEFHRSYLSGTKHFATGNVQEVLGAGATWHHISSDTLALMFSEFFKVAGPRLEEKLLAS